MAKTTKAYTAEELKAKCQAALADPKLIELARLTPSQVHDKAFEYVYEKTKDLQTAKKLAVVTRFLAILWRDHREEFEKVAQQEQPKPPENKTIYDFEFNLPISTELTTKETIGLSAGREFAIKFRWNGSLLCFLQEILKALKEVKLSTSIHEPYDLRSMMVKFLEEKFGLEVKEN